MCPYKYKYAGSFWDGQNIISSKAHAYVDYMSICIWQNAYNDQCIELKANYTGILLSGALLLNSLSSHG